MITWQLLLQFQKTANLIVWLLDYLIPQFLEIAKLICIAQNFFVRLFGDNFFLHFPENSMRKTFLKLKNSQSKEIISIIILIQPSREKKSYLSSVWKWKPNRSNNCHCTYCHFGMKRFYQECEKMLRKEFTLTFFPNMATPMGPVTTWPWRCPEWSQNPQRPRQQWAERSETS